MSPLEEVVEAGVQQFKDPPITAEQANNRWRFLESCHRMIEEASDRGAPLTQEQLRIICRDALTGGKG